MPAEAWPPPDGQSTRFCTSLAVCFDITDLTALFFLTFSPPRYVRIAEPFSQISHGGKKYLRLRNWFLLSLKCDKCFPSLVFVSQRTIFITLHQNVKILLANVDITLYSPEKLHYHHHLVYLISTAQNKSESHISFNSI